MKKQLMYIILGLLVLILAACGQGTASTDPTTDTNDIEENVESDNPETTDDGEDEDTPAEEDVSGDVAENDTETETEADEELTTTPVELLFSDDQVMDMYRVERQIEASDEELFVATLQAWASGPTEEGLVSLIPENVEVQSVEEKEGVAFVSFSPELLEAQVGSGVEEMLLQQVAVIMKQFGFNETQVLIDGEIVPELFGHIDTGVPIVASNPDDYEKVE
ncbi:GerMN domain-containing protein [bacterium LRH843]|nr:GerMN domain-containing protein [bacterium LRH843]